MAEVHDDEQRVKALSIDQKRALAGLALFKEDEKVELDTDGANKYKDEVEAKMAKLDLEASLLTGKDNKKARQEKDKEKTALKVEKQYIDACKVAKGVHPPNGFFIKKCVDEAAEAKKRAEDEVKANEARAAAEAAANVTVKKEAKPKKEQESAGISRAEKDELEKMKNDIISRKKELKEQGMSGGQMNKDEEIVKWVARMNELKEKENPGALQAQKDEKKGGKKKKVLDSAAQIQLEEKQKAFDEYLHKLQTEFKYTKKEINVDPDYMEMKAELEKLTK